MGPLLNTNGARIADALVLLYIFNPFQIQPVMTSDLLIV